jgi:hypothetical protein
VESLNEGREGRDGEKRERRMIKKKNVKDES